METGQRRIAGHGMPRHAADAGPSGPDSVTTDQEASEQSPGPASHTRADSIDTTPIESALKPLQPLELEQVRRTGDEGLYNSLIEEHHYLGYEQPVGEHLKYVVWSQGRPIACLAWSSAPRHLGCRDRFIGWNKEARRRNIRFIAYNTRFLIVPW